MKKVLWGLGLFLVIISSFTLQWKIKQPKDNRPTIHQYTNVLRNVRLGDGTLLGVETNVRWKVDSLHIFFDQFESMESYATNILYPRQSELSNKITSQYNKLMFKRTKIREQLQQQIANRLCQQMGELGIQVLEVQITAIYKQQTLAEIIASFRKARPKLPVSKLSKSKQPIALKPVTKKQSLNHLRYMKSSTIAMLEKAEGVLGEKFIINSSFRTAAHNRRVNGVPNSAHLRGYAVDIAVYSKAHRQKVIVALTKVGFKRIGIYATHVHADNDPSLKIARWHG